jgi:hypothetical protein
MSMVMDWQMIGSWAEWATAATAFLAVIVATVAGIATWNTNKAQQETLELQRQQFEIAREQSERAQASKVTYGLGSDLAARMARLRGPEMSPDASDTGVALVIINASDSPIYSVALIEGAPTPQLMHAESAIFPTGPTPAPLATGLRVNWPDLTRRLYFEDTSGIAWIREVSGRLRKASKDEADAVLHMFEIIESRASDQNEVDPPVGAK